MNQYISEDEIVALLQEIVQYPTVNPPADTTECAKFILERLNENGISGQLREGKGGVANLVARLSGRKRGKVLLLNGHIDVVAPGEGWTVDPFGAEAKDGMIYGRGTSDMKSGLLANLFAVKSLVRAGFKPKGTVMLHSVVDEEAGGAGGTLACLMEGYTADGMI